MTIVGREMKRQLSPGAYRIHHLLTLRVADQEIETLALVMHHGEMKRAPVLRTFHSYKFWTFLNKPEHKLRVLP
jgi:hypothetical protein